MRALGLRPMFLGLDLRGGIHVLIDVDMDAAVAQARERYTNDIRTLLRKEKVRYLTRGDGRRAHRRQVRRTPRAGTRRQGA